MSNIWCRLSLLQELSNQMKLSMSNAVHNNLIVDGWRSLGYRYIVAGRYGVVVLVTTELKIETFLLLNTLSRVSE